MNRIPVYQTDTGALFDGLSDLLKAAGLDAICTSPVAGTSARRVGDLAYEAVDDPAVYLVECVSEPTEKASFSVDIRLAVDPALVAKDAAPEERFVLSLVLEPNDGADGAPFAPDTQGDVYSAADIAKTAWGWMEKGGQIDLMHNWQGLGPEKVRVLESYLAPVDFAIGATAIRKGTWLLGLRILDDGLWQAVKTGKIGAFSVGGTALRKPVDPQEAP